MKNALRPGEQSTDPGGTAESRALDRFENEGGPGPEDTRGSTHDALAPAPARERENAAPERVGVAVEPSGETTRDRKTE